MLIIDAYFDLWRVVVDAVNCRRFSKGGSPQTDCELGDGILAAGGAMIACCELISQ